MTTAARCRQNRIVEYLVQFPVDGGGSLLVQASQAELPQELELAALRPGEIAAKAKESLEHAFEQVKPGLEAVVGSLRAMAPHEIEVEFGIVLSAESGVVLAKGSADVHFSVKLSWKQSEETRRSAQTEPGISHSDKSD